MEPVTAASVKSVSDTERRQDATGSGQAWLKRLSTIRVVGRALRAARLPLHVEFDFGICAEFAEGAIAELVFDHQLIAGEAPMGYSGGR